MSVGRDLRSVERNWRGKPLWKRATELERIGRQNPPQAMDIVALLGRTVSGGPLSDKSVGALSQLGTLIVGLDPGLISAFLDASVKHETGKKIIYAIVPMAETRQDFRAVIKAFWRVRPKTDQPLGGADTYMLLAAARSRPGRLDTILDEIVDHCGCAGVVSIPGARGNLLLAGGFFIQTEDLPDNHMLNVIGGLIERGVSLTSPCFEEDLEGRTTRQHRSVMEAVAAQIDRGLPYDDGLNALLACGAAWGRLDQGNGRAAQAIRRHPAWRRAQMMASMDGGDPSTRKQEDRRL